jgi:hypothetical protein
MSLFVFNPFRVGEELTPAQLRRTKMMAWLRVILRPVKYISDLFIDDFCKGSTYADYNNAATYVIYDRVIWQDRSVYELRVATATGIDPTGNSASSVTWLKVQDNFIGVDERVRYNGQLIVFEYAINRWFRVSAAPYIYCDPIVVGAVNYFVNINVPAAVYATLGPNNTARDNRIKEFADKYILAAYVLVITPY